MSKGYPGQKAVINTIAFPTTLKRPINDQQMGKMAWKDAETLYIYMK